MAKILAVEDEPSLQKLLEYQLKRIGLDERVWSCLSPLFVLDIT